MLYVLLESLFTSKNCCFMLQSVFMSFLFFVFLLKLTDVDFVMFLFDVLLYRMKLMDLTNTMTSSMALLTLQSSLFKT